MLRHTGLLMNQAGDPPPGGTPPATPVTPPAPNGAPPVVNAKAEAARLLGYDPDNPPWLAGRLTEAGARALKDVGITDPAKAKKTLEDAQKLEDEQKSVAEKLATATTQLTSAKGEAERLRAVTTEFAARQMLGLTAEQQQAVKAIAGDDPASQLRAITALQPTWGTPAPLPGSPPPVSAPPPVPASGTSPAPNAPNGAPISPTDPKAIHAGLVNQNPFTAARFAIENVREVYPEQPKS